MSGQLRVCVCFFSLSLSLVVSIVKKKTDRQAEVEYTSCRTEGGAVRCRRFWDESSEMSPWLWCSPVNSYWGLTQSSGREGTGTDQNKALGRQSEQEARKERGFHPEEDWQTLGLWQDSHTVAPETTHCKSIKHTHSHWGRERNAERDPEAGGSVDQMTYIPWLSNKLIVNPRAFSFSEFLSLHIQWVRRRKGNWNFYPTSFFFLNTVLYQLCSFSPLLLICFTVPHKKDTIRR